MEEIVEETTEIETPVAAPAVEEIDTAPKPVTVNPTKPTVTQKREEPPPNPLLLDPYEWERVHDHGWVLASPRRDRQCERAQP